MFESKKSTTPSEVNVNGNNRIINETKIKGEINSLSDFRIDGHVDGIIKTTGRLVVGKTGVIKGTVECTNADVEGLIEGEVVVKGVLNLKATANVQGNVRAEKLSIEPGAIFNVKCEMGDKIPLDTKKIQEKKEINA